MPAAQIAMIPHMCVNVNRPCTGKFTKQLTHVRNVWSHQCNFPVRANVPEPLLLLLLVMLLELVLLLTEQPGSLLRKGLREQVQGG